MANQAPPSGSAPRSRVAALLNASGPLENVLVKGWVRTVRDQKGFAFLEINDGSCLKNLQVIAEGGDGPYETAVSLTTGCSVQVSGRLAASPGKGQDWELKAGEILLIGDCPESFPLQKKRHSDEFLRTIAHLRPRTNKFGALFRIRSSMALAVHNFFADRGFVYIQTPIITGSDCEGAGEMFTLTTQAKGETLAPEKDFFGKPAYLTVSGQLEAEMYALALGAVYTFGPTFRAENSNTSRHAAEFWMIEPEAAFADLNDNMALGEELVRHLASHALEKCSQDVDLFARFVDKTLSQTLDNIINNDFVRMTYMEAVEALQKSDRKFQYQPMWGKDLQTEHERYITEEYCKKPVIVYDYPASIKPFYMRMNPDGKTVAAMDVLVPRIGEIIGGSQREERLDMLEARIKEMGLSEEEYWWYLDSRRFGTAPHSGFGMGFERVLMMVTGVSNIRDVIPFPRTPGNVEF
ncbi:asparagine--tRNA ligase [Desulfatibacillum aliphaticivorans]|uniref:asparagine--tRNA ligase n=1 Tax=Desulfatibacillum aliphaticivorans TaxID=218208 RepID=UPI00041BBF1E|nr:asparagine--tRNA ligase [Desulfatibacillum aliphaticivorans]